MTRSRMSDALGELVEFGTRLEHWMWETLDELLDIAYDMFARLIELLLALMNLIFYVVCFLRDLCIGTIQTFANIFHGIVKIVTSINCEEIEDFAAACIVVILWIGAFKFAKNLVRWYHRRCNTDVGVNSVPTDDAQSTRFEWTSHRTPLNSNRDDPMKLCPEMCSDQKSTIRQSNQWHKEESESDSAESD